MTTNAPKAPKTKKIDLAVEIFKRHLPTRDTLTKRDFRAAVVADMKKELNVDSAGTLGMYFAWSDQLVSGRTAKQYNRTAPRRTKAAVAAAKDAADADGDLNKLVNDFDKAIAKSAVAKKPAAKKAPAKKAAPKKKPAKKASLITSKNLTASI